MRDIQRAMTYEREYILLRLNGEEPYSLSEKLTGCGFGSLEEYFSAKRDYLVDNLDFVVMDRASDEGALLTLNAAENGIAMVVFCKAADIGVYHGDGELDRELCEDRGIKVMEYGSSGGNIVISEGDMAIGLSIPVEDVSAGYILEHLAAIISTYTDDVTVDNNDILVDGLKVAGSASYNVGTGLGFVIHFSFSDKSEMIRELCGESEKKAGFLSCLDADELRARVISWLQKR